MALHLLGTLSILSNAELTSGSDHTEAIGSFQAELKTLFCEGLSVGGEQCDGQYGVQDFINSFHEYFDHDTKDVSDVVEHIMERVDNELNLRARFLTTMRDAINASCSSYRWGVYSRAESLVNFEHLHFAGNEDRSASLPWDMEYDAVYGQRVSLTKSTYRLPNNVDYTQEHIKRDVEVSYILEETMVDLHDAHCVDRYSVLHYVSDGMSIQHSDHQSINVSNVYITDYSVLAPIRIVGYFLELLMECFGVFQGSKILRTVMDNTTAMIHDSDRGTFRQRVVPRTW